MGKVCLNHIKKSLLVFVTILLSSTFLYSYSSENENDISSESKGPATKATKNFLRYASPLNAFNVKLMPALYWNTIGIELEYPLNDLLTVGLNIAAKSGRTDGERKPFKIRPETYQDPSYRVELAIKYYISQSAPVGLYAQLNFSYGNLLYYDGTNKPFTLHSRWKSFNQGIRAPTDLTPPKEYSFGLGAGYQLIVIPKHIIANIMLGTQIFIDQENKVYPALYVQPSIGYVF